MPSMRELILASPDFQRQAKEVNKDLDRIAQSRLGTVSDEVIYYFNAHKGTKTELPTGFTDYEEVLAVGNRALELFHQAMWSKSMVRDNGKSYWVGKPADLACEVFNLYNGSAASGLARSLLAGGVMVGRFVRMEHGGPKPRTYLMEVRDPAKSYPNAESFAWQALSERKRLPRRAQVEVEQQAAKAEELAGPVKVIINLNEIPLPDANPDSVMTYVERIHNAFNKMQAAAAKADERLAAAYEQIEELQTKLEEAEKKQTQDDWGKVRTRIEELREES